VNTFALYLLLSLPLVGAYAILGLGITVIYQASRVLNLAHGAMAMGAAYATYQMSRWHVPTPLAVLAGIAFGALLGLLIERVFIRRLRSAGPTAQTVGTVGALTLAIAVASRVWGTQAVNQPVILPGGALRVFGGFVGYDLIGIFPIALLAGVALFALFRFTDVGLAMRGAAENRRGAALRGVDPDRTAMLVWVLGGALAGLAGILLSASTELDPFSISLGVLPAFVAALIGGLDSLPGVCLGAVVVGVVQGMVPAIGAIPHLGVVVQGQGAPELALSVLALAAMALRGNRLSTGDIRGDTL
jgi:branched-subunit amino acid ABC-type transport system permease component